MILGATNRLADVDAAILRRMPARFHIPLPDLARRRLIVNKILKGEKVNIVTCYCYLWPSHGLLEEGYSSSLSPSKFLIICCYA